MNDTSATSDAGWARRFLDAHLARHPVDATFVGLHEHDHRLPDLSEAGVEETLGTLRGWLAEAEEGTDTPGGEPTPSEAEGRAEFARLDRTLIRGFLRTRIQEYESGHVLGNPSAHVGDAVFGLMGPLLADPGRGPSTGTPTDDRPTENGPSAMAVEALRARTVALPAFLASVRDGLKSGRFRSGPPPVAWIRRAIRECRGGTRFLEEGLDRLGREGGATGPAGESGPKEPGPIPEESGPTAEERAAGVAAFEEFAGYLEHELLPEGGDDVACGGEAFELYLREGHFLDARPDEIVRYAREEIRRTRDWLEGAASDFGASSPEEVLAGLAERHPEAGDYPERYRETWDAMREVAIERELLTWPDFPIEYVPRPRWARAAAPDLYFLFYRSPPAFHRPEVHRYMVAPLDTDRPEEEVEAFLRANNDSVIKLNHVVHHGGIGHHVQNWHASRSPSLVGRVAAVDCASRIAMFCGGTMAEGWACYATDLMAEAGALTELEQYAEHHGRIRMCARAVVDVELHHGRMSMDEAIAFYRETAGMSAAGAEGEAVKNSMFPGAALMYLVGTDMIHELRRDLMRIQADDFSLRAFHDAFLSYGSVPVKLVADELRTRAEAGLPLGAHDHEFIITS